MLTAWAMAGLAQVDFDAIKERKTYVITLDNGQELPVWCEKKEGGYVAEIDEPTSWGDRKFFAASRIADMRPERKTDRYQRIKKWYESNGYTEVGEWRFYPAQEVAWAEQAMKTARDANKKFETPAPAPAPAVTDPATPAPPPSPIKQFGPHAALAVIAALLLLLVARTLIFGAS